MLFWPKKTFFTTDERLAIIHWKSISLLQKYMTRFARIKPRKFTGNTVKQQKKIRQAIIAAREIGLLPYTR